MEEKNTDVATPKKTIPKYVVPAAVLVIIVIAAIGFYLSTNKSSSINSTASSQSQNVSLSDTSLSLPSVATSAYKDGVYAATGNYVSPGGPRDIGLTITIKDDIVTDAIFEGRATDATTKRFQGEFADNFKPMVVGKNISDVMLTKVSGSSLTPKGFNDALEKIKQQAKSV